MHRGDKEFLLEKIAGMRDKLIHFYFGIKLDVVWVVLTQEIPELEKRIKEIFVKEDWDLPIF